MQKKVRHNRALPTIGWCLVLGLVSKAWAGLPIGEIDLKVTTAVAQTGIPIAGFSPQVVFGVTDAIDSMTEWDALGQPTIVGTPLPAGNPYYSVCIFDTGATTHLLSRSDRAGFGIAGTGSTFELIGAGPNPVIADIMESSGYFANGLQSLYGSGVTPNTAGFKGVSNVRAMGARTDDLDLPTVVGTPFAVNYTTVIRPDHTYTGEYNGKSYTTPRIDFYTSPEDPEIPLYNHRLNATFKPNNPLPIPPTYIPEGFEDFGIYPSPTVSVAMFVQARTDHNGRFSSGEFLFDTGAQITVLSSAKARDLGLDLNNPEFTVEISGVGGTLAEAPGFTIDELTLPAGGGIGDLVLTNVPIVVHNVSDGSGGYTAGIIGMNLFTDRSIIIDPNTSSPSIGITDIIGIPGDANRDGLVDVGDLGILAGNYGTSGYASWSMGDFNHDGMVDVGDLGILAGNYGYCTAGGANVPEPASLALVVFGVLTASNRRRFV